MGFPSTQTSQNPTSRFDSNRPERPGDYLSDHPRAHGVNTPLSLSIPPSSLIIRLSPEESVGLPAERITPTGK